jgi:phenylalanyl-tRNA synthetase beta chain
LPVVEFIFERFKKFFPGRKLDDVLRTLPYIGLDIESIDREGVRLEYNPNRPDFASDYGIARAVKGLLGTEEGIPKFKLAGRSGFVIQVDRSTKQIRPWIVSLVAKNGELDEETIKQLITMQEDLQNVIGRKRINSSIGIHNLDVIEFPVTYKTVRDNFSFVPLGDSSRQTLGLILRKSVLGKQYGYILRGFERYPIVEDAKGNVLSFPPIVNSDLTRIDTQTKNLFVEVTGSDLRLAEDILAIMAMTLYDAGFEIQTVSIASSRGRSRETPRMDPFQIEIKKHFINNILGLNLKINDVLKCLSKSRLNGQFIYGDVIRCTIPRYRTDIIDCADLVEEVAIGYGVYNLRPSMPASDLAGNRNFLSGCLDIARETMVGLGILEVVNFSLVSRKIEYQFMGIPERNSVLSVDQTRSIEHEVLRESLTPSLMQTLSHNIHEEYPQKIFEIGKIFQLSDKIVESWKLGFVVSHSRANYTEGKSIVQTLLKVGFGKDTVTAQTINPILVPGRSSDIRVDNISVGYIGEIQPIIMDNFKLRVPVVASEINLSQVLLIR